MIRIEALSGTPNWVAARKGMLTASRMHDAMNYKKSGDPSQKRIDYMMDLVAERVTGIATDHYVTAAMQWGLDHEEDAKLAFENETGLIVRSAGLVLHPRIDNFGATPDGVVSLPNLQRPVTVEIKCPTTPTFVEWRMLGRIPPEHLQQMLAQMACCEVSTSIFIAYDPRVVRGRNLIWHELNPMGAEIHEIEQAAKVFLQETEEMFNAFVTRESNDGSKVVQADRS